MRLVSRKSIRESERSCKNRIEVPTLSMVPNFVGCSSAHRALLERLAKFARTTAEILITGPTGSGKERYARYVHAQSPRVQKEFVPINCGAVPDTLLENELFGHVGGAFTGARPQSEGVVAAAEGGTLFLDEVDALSPTAQVKLLRFIQEKEYRRLGESRTRRANVRFIAAANSDLREAVQQGKFREDLLFRLRVIPVEIPPLSQRSDDLTLLIPEFSAHYAELYGLPPVEFTDAALTSLKAYSWPGNVRELENCVQYLTCLQLERPVNVEDLPLLTSGEQNITPKMNGSLVSFQKAKQELVNLFERDYLEEALRRSRGNIAEAARASGKARRAFFELMRKHGVQAVNALNPPAKGNGAFEIPHFH